MVVYDVQDYSLADLLIVPTCQRSKMDLVQTGEAVETEKDDLLEKVESVYTLYTSFLMSSSALTVQLCSSWSLQKVSVTKQLTEATGLTTLTLALVCQ